MQQKYVPVGTSVVPTETQTAQPVNNSTAHEIDIQIPEKSLAVFDVEHDNQQHLEHGEETHTESQTSHPDFRAPPICSRK